jgi:phospho-N-acetylmuramoyl-pentapeptide-transferase
MVPFFKAPVVADLTVPGALVFMFLVLVGTTNAVNLTDGLDGLAAGCMNSVSAAYLALAYVAGNVIFANYLQVPSVSGAHELAVFCGCLLGGASGSSGGTPIPPRCSWATPAAWRWAGRSRWSPSSSSRS